MGKLMNLISSLVFQLQHYKTYSKRMTLEEWKELRELKKMIKQMEKEQKERHKFVKIRQGVKE